ncbi:MAG: hypothetical protein ABR874_07395 [Candidatus Sulfotelmatobacter sp.]|jgi:hypothetical protein
MASGTAPALDPNLKPKDEASQSGESKPKTFGQRIKALLHEMFAGREEHLGWRQ